MFFVMGCTRAHVTGLQHSEERNRHALRERGRGVRATGTGPLVLVHGLRTAWNFSRWAGQRLPAVRHHHPRRRRAFREFLRSVHLDLAAQAIASGDSSVEANAVYAKFLSTIQAIVARGNYMTVDQHTPPFS